MNSWRVWLVLWWWALVKCMTRKSFWVSFLWRKFHFFSSNVQTVPVIKLLSSGTCIMTPWLSPHVYCVNLPGCRRKLPFLCMLIQRTWPPLMFRYLLLVPCHMHKWASAGLHIRTVLCVFCGSVFTETVSKVSNNDTWSHRTKCNKSNVMGTGPRGQ